MTLTQSSYLQTGQLDLIACNPVKNSCEILDTYKATSGLPGWQAPRDRNVRGKGPIPDSDFTPKKQPLFLDTKGVYSSLPGIKGNFYPILPYTIRTPVRTRSAFGLHADKNVPGTAGCIGVIAGDDFQRLEEKIKEISATGVEEIPLVVDYQVVTNPRI